jgi:hypothetical protein
MFVLMGKSPLYQHIMINNAILGEPFQTPPNHPDKKLLRSDCPGTAVWWRGQMLVFTLLEPWAFGLSLQVVGIRGVRGENREGTNVHVHSFFHVHPCSSTFIQFYP